MHERNSFRICRLEGVGCAFTGTSIGAATNSATHALLLEVNEARARSGTQNVDRRARFFKPPLTSNALS